MIHLILRHAFFMFKPVVACDVGKILVRFCGIHPRLEVFHVGGKTLFHETLRAVFRIDLGYRIVETAIQRCLSRVSSSAARNHSPRNGFLRP